ncbi:vacuolar protein sorting-associated protein 32-like protein, partial [Thalictrum thalictroides]
ALELLEKKVAFSKKKVSAEVDMAKKHLWAKNETAAIHCLKSKLIYEHDIEIRGSYQLFICNQIIVLERATATMETVEASRNGADTLKRTNKEMIIDNRDKMMDEINEQTENVKQIQEASSAPIGAAADLDKSLELLVKRVSFLKMKVSAEVDMAKEHLMAKNKTAAIHCLKRKLAYEHEIEIRGSYQPFIRNQMIVLESATATMETVEASRNGADTLKRTNKEMIINNVDKMMDEINEQTEQTENVKQIQEVLLAPIGAAADFDEDELEAAELEEQLLQPAATAPPAAVNVRIRETTDSPDYTSETS